YSPLHDDEGRIAGIVCVVTEDTPRVVAERRLALLRDMALQLSLCETSDEVWMAVCHAPESHAHDLPFTLPYLVDEAGGALRLVATRTIARGHPGVPHTLALDDRHWAVRQVLESAPAATTVVALPSD